MSASERRGAARTAVVWHALRDVLAHPRAVLDIGGGTGEFAVHAAELGHRVSVVDPSPDALAALDRRAREAEVDDRVTAQQGDLSTLHETIGAASVDVVLCHGVLEVVEDPAEALETLAEVLRPGGSLSILVAQRHAAVIARAMAGHFGSARAILDGESGGKAGHRFTSDEVTGLLSEAGFTIDSVHGVRAFADLVPGSLLDQEPGATEALLDLEQAVSTRPEYLPLATQVHVLAHR